MCRRHLTDQFFFIAELKTHWCYSDNTNTISIVHLTWPISPSILSAAALTFECLWTYANTSILSPGTYPFPAAKNCINSRSLILFSTFLTMEQWWKWFSHCIESLLTWSKLHLFLRFVSPLWASWHFMAMTITRTRPSHLSWPPCFASTLCSKMFWLTSPKLLTSSTWIIGTFFPWEFSLWSSWLWLVGIWRRRAWVTRSGSGQNLVFLWLPQSLSRVIGSKRKPCGFMMISNLILTMTPMIRIPDLSSHFSKKCFNRNIWNCNKSFLVWNKLRSTQFKLQLQL